MSGTLAMAKSVDSASRSRPVVQVGPEAKTAIEDILPDVSPDISPDISPLVVNNKVAKVTLNAPPSRCPQWFNLAMQYFSPDDWDTIDFLLYRESRCLLQALNPKDTNGKPSYSLFQINGFWCNPSKHYDQGFLQQHGVLATCDELFEPETQFRAARALYEEGLSRYGMGWHSWGSYPETR